MSMTEKLTKTTDSSSFLNLQDWTWTKRGSVPPPSTRAMRPLVGPSWIPHSQGLELGSRSAWRGLALSPGPCRPRWQLLVSGTSGVFRSPGGGLEQSASPPPDPSGGDRTAKKVPLHQRRVAPGSVVPKGSAQQRGGETRLSPSPKRPPPGLLCVLRVGCVPECTQGARHQPLGSLGGITSLLRGLAGTQGPAQEVWASLACGHTAENRRSLGL